MKRKSSETWRHVVWWKFTSVSERCSLHQESEQQQTEYYLSHEYNLLFHETGLVQVTDRGPDETLAKNLAGSRLYKKFRPINNRKHTSTVYTASGKKHV
jgi:hypothetical protein